jgi:hypothetical protein
MATTTEGPTREPPAGDASPAAGTGSSIKTARRSSPELASSTGFRVGGALLIVGGAVWQPMLGWEHLGNLGHRSASWTWCTDQAGFLVAMVLLLIGMAALDRARLTGASVTGRLAMHGLVLAWGLLVVAEVGDLVFHWTAADVLTGIGGLLTYPTTLVAGVAAIRAGPLTRWRRWALLGLGIYQIGVILVPLLLGAAGPGWPAEAGWQLGWITVGVAAVQQSKIAVTATHRALSTAASPWKQSLSAIVPTASAAARPKLQPRHHRPTATGKDQP